MSQYKRYCFIGEFFDQMAQLIRRYQIFYYPDDKSIEMFDMRTKKIYLKRIINPDVKQNDLFIGADVNIFGKKLKIVDYGDEYSRKTYEKIRSSTFVLILPNAYMNIGKIIDIINSNGFSISRLKMNRFTKDQGQEFLSIHGNNDVSLEQLCADLVVGIELVKENAVQEFKTKIIEIIKQNIKTENTQPNYSNLVICSESNDLAQIELEYYFKKIKHLPQLTNCSCLLLKPHIVNGGNSGKIIDIILHEGFEISSMELFHLDNTIAEDFLDVYKGVLPEYAPIINHLTSGPSIILEIRQEDVVNKLRALVGPHDPALARALRPNTLRAIFGKDRVLNVCHCTDLPEDGVLECSYFFDLLQD